MKILKSFILKKEKKISTLKHLAPKSKRKKKITKLKRRIRNKNQKSKKNKLI